MKNDFDFIKEKFDEQNINAPDELNEEFVKEKIQNVEPLKVKKDNTKFIFRVSIAAVIAVVLIHAVVLTGIVGIMKMGPAIITDPFGINTNTTSSAGLTNFKSYDEVENKLGDIISKQKSSPRYDIIDDILDYGANGAAAESNEKTFSGDAEASLGTSGGSADDHSQTYIQTLGVDEADEIKTDGEFIYYLSNDRMNIEIYKATNGKTKFCPKIESPESYPEMYGDYFAKYSEFYVNGDKLTAIAADNYYSLTPMTAVCVFDISDKGNIKLENCFRQSGNYCSSRMIDGTVYLVTTYYANNKDNIPYCFGSGEDEKRIDAECIYTVDDPERPNFLVVSSLDTNNKDSKTNSKAILGSANEVYCSNDNLYVIADVYPSGKFYYSAGETNTQIVKISLKDDLEFKATAKVKGIVNDQYSLDENNGNLRVATTSNENKGIDSNNLYVLDSELKELGKVTGFAKNESIKAVRYIGNTAYVITYEQTDPLFIIDLSDPEKPEITGEVKISGFSTMLVPIDENTLLGIGYQTVSNEFDAEAMEIQDGLKLVTFDISDKSNPKIKDTKVFENCDSTVQYNPKALVYNSTRNDYIIPVNYHYYESIDRYYDGGTADGYEAYSGVLNFRIENGFINITDQYASDVFSKGNNNKSVERCVYISDYIYMLGYRDYIDYEVTDDYDRKEAVNNASDYRLIDSVKYK